MLQFDGTSRNANQIHFKTFHASLCQSTILIRLKRRENDGSNAKREAKKQKQTPLKFIYSNRMERIFFSWGNLIFVLAFSATLFYLALIIMNKYVTNCIEHGVTWKHQVNSISILASSSPNISLCWALPLLSFHFSSKFTNHSHCYGIYFTIAKLLSKQAKGSHAHARRKRIREWKWGYERKVSYKRTNKQAKWIKLLPDPSISCAFSVA